MEADRVVFVVERLNVVVRIDPKAKSLVEAQATGGRLIGDPFNLKDDGFVRCRKKFRNDSAAISPTAEGRVHGKVFDIDVLIKSPVSDQSDKLILLGKDLHMIAHGLECRLLVAQ